MSTALLGAAGGRLLGARGRGARLLAAGGVLGLAAFTALAGSACAHKRYHFPPPLRPEIGSTQTGVASWYGPQHQGKRTSSGERFDMNDLTAAHATFAFGTRVKVTLLSSRRSVVVRINDRFPNHKGRLIDLSRAAAREIGLMRLGTGRVKLEVVG